MQNQESSVVFDQERAASYDKQFAKLAPMRDALHLLTRIILSDLPADARILCVGAGTGSELIYLAQAFPHWQFTAVEPAAAMLKICRQKAEECDITSRCTFHEGYLNSLPNSNAFDAATCLLVSQFIMQQDERSKFFRQIGDRLRPDGYLVSADLAADLSDSAYESLFGVWLRALKYSEVPAEEAEKFRATYRQSVALLPPQIVESIIASSGFNTPILFLQTLLIHAWYAQRTS